MTAKKIKFQPLANERLTPAEEYLYDTIMETLLGSKRERFDDYGRIIDQFELFSNSPDRKELSKRMKDTLDTFIADRAAEREQNSIIENQLTMDIFDHLKMHNKNTYTFLEVILGSDPYFFNERGEWALKIPYHDLEKMKEYRAEINETRRQPEYEEQMDKEFGILADNSRYKTFGSEYKKKLHSVLGMGIMRDIYAQTHRVTAPEFAMLDISDMFYILSPSAIFGRAHGETAWDLRKQLPDFYPNDPLLSKTDDQIAIKNVLLCYDDLFNFDFNFKTLFKDFDNNRDEIGDEILRLYTTGDIDGIPIERTILDDEGHVISIEGKAIEAVYNVRDILKSEFEDHLLPIEKVVTKIEMTSPRRHGYGPFLGYEISIFIDLLYSTLTNKANLRSIWLFNDEIGAERFHKKLTGAYRDIENRRSLGIPNYVKPIYTEGKDTLFTLLSDSVYHHNRSLKGVYRKKNAFIFFDGINYPTGQSFNTSDFKQDVYMGFIADVLLLTKSLITDHVYRLANHSKKASMMRGSKTDNPYPWEQDIISHNQTFRYGIDYVNDILTNFQVISGIEESEIMMEKIDFIKTKRITEKNRYSKVEPRREDAYYADLKFVIDDNLDNNRLGREFQLRTPLAEHNALKTASHGERKYTKQDKMVAYLISKEPGLSKDSIRKTLTLIDSYFAYHYLEHLKNLSIPDEVAKLQEAYDDPSGYENIERNMHLAKHLIEGTIKENLIRANYAFPNLTTEEKDKVRGFFLSNPPKVEGFNADKLNQYIKIRLEWEKPNFS